MFNGCVSALSAENDSSKTPNTLSSPFPDASSAARRTSSTTTSAAAAGSASTVDDGSTQQVHPPPPLEEEELMFKVLLIGDPGVGKTSFVHRYTNNSFRYKSHSWHFRHLKCAAIREDYKGTVGVDFALKVLRLSPRQRGGRPVKVKLQMWDVAGECTREEKRTKGGGEGRAKGHMSSTRRGCGRERERECGHVLEPEPRLLTAIVHCPCGGKKHALSRAHSGGKGHSLRSCLASSKMRKEEERNVHQAK